MKTKINRMALAIFFAAFLFAANVEAEGKGLHAFSGLENVTESKLQIENWMINDAYWDFTRAVYTFQTETENVSRIESWMLDDNLWEIPALKYLASDKDAPLCVEDWMIHGKYWN